MAWDSRNVVSHSLKGQKSEWNQSVNRVAALPPKTRRESFLASSSFSWLHTFLGFCLHNSILCFHVNMVFFLFLKKTLSLGLESTWIIQSSHNSVQNANWFLFSVFQFSLFQFTASVYLELQNYINSTVLRRGKSCFPKKSFLMYPIKLLGFCHGFSVL